MPTITRVVPRNRKKGAVKSKSPARDNSPKRSGVRTHGINRPPKKPRSELRKVVKLGLRNGKEVIAYIPGEDRNPHKQAIVLEEISSAEISRTTLEKLVIKAIENPHSSAGQMLNVLGTVLEKGGDVTVVGPGLVPVTYHASGNNGSGVINVRRITASAGVKKKAFHPAEAGKRIVDQLKLADGGALTGKDLKELYALTPATLERRRNQYGIIYWRDAKHAFHYPRWQFNEAGALLHGIKPVLKTFQSRDEWRVMRYFLTPRQQLDGEKPLDLLRRGEAEKVIAHAKAHGEENTW